MVLKPHRWAGWRGLLEYYVIRASLLPPPGLRQMRAEAVGKRAQKGGHGNGEEVRKREGGREGERIGAVGKDKAPERLLRRN